MKYLLIILIVILIGCESKKNDTGFNIYPKPDHMDSTINICNALPEKYFMCSYWKTADDHSKWQVGSFFFEGQMVSMDSLVRKANDQSDIKQNGTVIIMSISRLDSSDYFTVIKQLLVRKQLTIDTATGIIYHK